MTNPGGVYAGSKYCNNARLGVVAASANGDRAAGEYRSSAQLGLITAATMVTALIIDFTLLSSLLLIGHKDKKGATS